MAKMGRCDEKVGNFIGAPPSTRAVAVRFSQCRGLFLGHILPHRRTERVTQRLNAAGRTIAVGRLRRTLPV